MYIISSLNPRNRKKRLDRHVWEKSWENKHANMGDPRMAAKSINRWGILKIETYRKVQMKNLIPQSLYIYIYVSSLQIAWGYWQNWWKLSGPCLLPGLLPSTRCSENRFKWTPCELTYIYIYDIYLYIYIIYIYHIYICISMYIYIYNIISISIYIYIIYTHKHHMFKIHV